MSEEQIKKEGKRILRVELGSLSREYYAYNGKLYAIFEGKVKEASLSDLRDELQLAEDYDIEVEFG